MAPLRFREDAASRRWLAARAMRVPLVVIKFGSPVLVIGALAVIVRQPNLAAQPVDVLTVLALPFGVPFLLAAIYPLVRWAPQEWRLDEAGVHGRGRVSATCPWAELGAWTMAPTGSLPDVFHVAFQRAPAWRHRRSSMMVRAADRTAVEAWLSTGRAHPPRPVPSG